MFKALIDKQFMEVFRSYFYNYKKNALRKKSTVIVVVLSLFLMVGSMFYFTASFLCETLSGMNLDWFYFGIMGLTAIALGTFGSVFSTYSSLYLAKDNDLLLSLPISNEQIIASRLIPVYVSGLIYSSLALIPTIIVYWSMHNLSITIVFSNLLFILVNSFIVLLLSCLLGYGVARLTLKIKHNSIATLLISLLFIGAYYYFYFNASSIFAYLLENAIIYGDKIKSSAYPLYLFGLSATGDIKAILIVSLAVIVCCYLLWRRLSNSFLTIVTTNSGSKKNDSKTINQKKNSLFVSLVSKEFSKFISNANYMLNCGLATLIIPVASIGLLIKSDEIIEMVSTSYGGGSEELVVISCIALALMITMNDLAVCSLSLEGKSLWIVKSLPIKSFDILKSKLALQLLLTLPGACLFSICCWIVLNCGFISGLMMILVNTSITVLFGLFCLFLGILGCNLNWTNEIIVIKQNMTVLIAIFGGWIAAIAVGFVYFRYGYLMNTMVYLVIWLAINCLLSVILYYWLRKEGVKQFERL